MFKLLLLGLCTTLGAAGCAVERATTFNDSTAAIDRNCLTETGTHIQPREGECAPVAGRSYSQRDLDRTGAITTGEALRMLDPAVTVGR